MIIAVIASSKSRKLWRKIRKLQDIQSICIGNMETFQSLAPRYPKMPQASGVNSGSFGWKRPSHDLAPDPVGHWVAKNGSKLGSPWVSYTLDQYESIWYTSNCWYWHIISYIDWVSTRPLGFVLINTMLNHILGPHSCTTSAKARHFLSASSAHVPHLMRPSVKLASVLSFLRS